MPWSIVDSASSNSQLAGFLAGLLVATITVLIASGKLREVRTLGMLSAAMVSLALDSYLFSYLTGLHTEPAEPVCARAWVQGMAASGVLALGAVALMVGIAVMLVQRLMTLEEARDKLADRDETRSEKKNIVRISAALSAAVVGATTVLLAAAFDQYLRFVLAGWDWAAWPIFLTAAAVVLGCWFVILRRTMTITTAIAGSGHKNIDIETRFLPLAAMLVVAHALITSGYGALMIYSNEEAGETLGIIATYAITVAMPAGISILTSMSVPKQVQ